MRAPSGRPLTVLIVDEIRAGAEALSHMLTHWGYCCRVANDARDALEQLGDGRADVLVLDMDMPWTGAFPLLRQLDRLPGNPLLVGLSAIMPLEHCREAKRAGFDHVLLKPLDPDELARLLEERSRQFRTDSAIVR